MKIVIDIPKEEYLKLIKTDENGEKEIPLGLLLSLWDSVKYKCTPLPKGHGRLIEVSKELECELWTYTRYTGIDEAPYEDATNALELAPTIIEADKAESEKKNEQIML